MNVTGDVNLSVSADIAIADALSSGVIPDAISFVQALSNGTGAGKIQQRMAVKKTTVASTPDSYVLSSYVDPNFGTLALTAVRVIIIVNRSTTAGQDLIFEPDATQPWLAPFASVADGKYPIKAGGVLLLVDPNNGFPVTAGSADRFKIDPGANAIPYSMLFLGE